MQRINPAPGMGSSRWIGIDFGTSMTSAAYLADGAPTLIPIAGEKAIPSSVYMEEDGRLVVGIDAERSAARAPRRYRREFKRTLGTPFAYSLGGRSLRPDELVAEILRKVREEAQKELSAGSLACVLTIPVRFAPSKQELMYAAAESAGFADVELVQEPVAAAAYAAWRGPPLASGDIILVYDLGGGTFDAALLQWNGREFRALEQSAGDDRLGGVDFDEEIYDASLREDGTGLADSLAAAMSDEAADAEPLRRHLELLEQARGLKHSLSVNHEDSFDLPGSYREFTLTRPEFEGMITSYIDRSCDICERLLRGAGVKPQQVGKVVLVGGSVRIPFVSQRLRERLGMRVVVVEQPDYAVSLGAALFSGRLPEGRVPASARWRFRDACVKGQDRLHQDAGVEAQLRVLSAALNLRDEDAARIRAVPQLRAAYDRLMAALSGADWFQAELETRRVIQLASGYDRIVSEEMAMMIPAEVMAALDRLWILSGGGPLHSRKCVAYTAFGMSDFRAWNSCETWLQWRLRQLSMDRHRALRSAVGASLAGG